MRTNDELTIAELYNKIERLKQELEQRKSTNAGWRALQSFKENEYVAMTKERDEWKRRCENEERLRIKMDCAWADVNEQLEEK